MIKIIRIATNKKAQRETAVFTLVTGRVFTVGRKGSDLSFEDDTSISRSHAEILVEHPLANVGTPALPPSLRITDLGSKFGTYVNQGIESKVKVSVRESQILGSSDKFRFGLQWNQYRIEYTPLVVTTSTMKDISGLKETIRSLGAHLVSDWREGIDFLVMESIVMTIKVVAALISGKSIVTPEYFHDYLKAVQAAIDNGWEGEPEQPNPYNYLPPLNERSLNGQDALFHPESTRSETFTGKYFLLPDAKAVKNYKSIIETGGGKVDMLSKVDQRKLSEPGTIVIGDEAELEDNEDPRVKSAIASYLASGKRIVAEKELGLAALHQDTSIYLNPTGGRGLAEGVSQSFPTQSVSSQNQEQTQHVFYTNTPLGRSVITDSQKREREDDSEDEPTAGPSKRSRSELMTMTMSSSANTMEDSETRKQKRLADLFDLSDSDEDDEPVMPPPPKVMSKRTTRSQVPMDDTQMTEVVPATPVTQPEPSGSSSSLRRSPRKSTGSTFQSFLIPESQDPYDEEMVLSGIVPATPESLDQPTLVTSSSSRASTTFGNSRQKRRRLEEVEDEEQEEQGNEIGSKKPRVLTDVGGNGDVTPTSSVSVPAVVHARNGTATVTVTTGDEVRALGYQFVSLVFSNGRNPREQSVAEPNGRVVNFKKFRKVSPVFTVSRPIVLVPHTTDTMENGERFMDSVQVPAARGPRSRRAQTNGHHHDEASPPATRRGRRNVPIPAAADPVPPEEIEDDFSFNN